MNKDLLPFSCNNPDLILQMMDMFTPFLALSNNDIHHLDFVKDQTIFLTQPQEMLFVVSGMNHIFT
ncbi:MAG: hypothetical protein EBU93_08135, partial [Chlamydiae bacterium]|nr:hypothetical protein [Chlamydiota bacterium]